MAIAPKALPPSRSLPPPKIAPHIAMRATKVMPSATAAATELMRMSRLLDVRQLVGEHAAQLVVGRAPAGCPASRTPRRGCGLRPVANALGCISGDTYSFGIGMSAALA